MPRLIRKSLSQAEFDKLKADPSQIMVSPNAANSRQSEERHEHSDKPQEEKPDDSSFSCLPLFTCEDAMSHPITRGELLSRLALWFAVCLLLLGASVGSIFKASADFSSNEKSKANEIISSVASNFKSLLSNSLGSVHTMSSFIEEGPAPMHSSVMVFTRKVAPSLLATSAAIHSVQLEPYGVVAEVYPIVSKFWDATPIYAAGGHDLFDPNSPLSNHRSDAIHTLNSRVTQIAGPMKVFGNSLAAANNLGLLCRKPLFAPTTNTSDEWGDTTWPSPNGLPPLGPFHHVHDCGSILFPATGRSLCASNATGDGRRFWGFYTVSMKSLIYHMHNDNDDRSFCFGTKSCSKIRCKLSQTKASAGLSGGVQRHSLRVHRLTGCSLATRRTSFTRTTLGP